ncbi:extracellular solute-binding protein family 5 [Kribbella flavida DSM 17836]|uniref:Extracellular solute-binding protein family 5 n=1 Tax=Kribbella flavida (strain DSM 17836 / JCM 10339 / NBRC 14399) TaxID=479435 RepID=D2PYW8_KRIFD|nr:ABC transporter substrate-binding protein [Kribbella flavida]ADB31762.1 extracellular solute-binding protein family 5 [Kribbella flavida DSM 17836]
MQWKRITAVAATVMLTVAACGSPSSNNNTGGSNTGDAGTAQEKATDPSVKGPAPEIEGAKKGGTITVLSDVTPDTFDPTNIYYTDGNQIGKLIYRALTQYKLDEKTGKPILVPDLAEDLGTKSADGLTWTFKLKQGIKYMDGTEVKAEDYAYAIKRSFAHDLYDAGPTYQLQFFKDGDKYKGPYAAGGDNYAGVETPDNSTLVIKLAKKFDDLPFYAAFPMFTPIPKAKDTKKNYEQKPMTTGPYQVESLTPGSQLVLSKNPNWDPNTDPVRYQYPDKFDFKFAQDTIKVQRQVLASSGPDANALNYSNLDVSLYPEVKDQSQIIKGGSPCTITWPLDTRKIPFEIRQLIAKAYPFDSWRKVAGLDPQSAIPASTILPPAVPGHEKYELPGLVGKGKGAEDEAVAAEVKAKLKELGKENFELSWYYSNDDKIATQVNQLRTQVFQKAGFKVKAIGVPKAKIRTLTGDQNAPVNVGKTPAGWCSDWPSGTSWFPVLFKSDAIALGNSIGQLQDKALDAEIDRIAAMDPNQQLKEWSKVDRTVLEKHLPLVPLYYAASAFPVGKNIGHAINDVTQGMPEFTSLYLKQP